MLNIKIIGAGGIGGVLLPTLCRVLNYGVAGKKIDDYVMVKIIDGDVFEGKNVERQRFMTLENKAEATAALLTEFTNITISPVAEFVTKDNVLRLIREKDVVFLCVDNHATRKLISDHCEKELQTVTVISGGNELTDGNIQVFKRVSGINVTMPLANNFHPELVSPADRNPGEPRQGCEQVAPSQPQLLITNFAVASLMLNAFYAWTQDKLTYDECYKDVLTNKTRPVYRSNKGA